MGFDERERLVVTATRKVMGQLRWNALGQLLLRSRYFIGGGFQSFEMGRGIALIRFAIGDNLETFTQRFGRVA